MIKKTQKSAKPKQIKEASSQSDVPFGLHLMIDAYGCDPKVLDDPRKLYAFLDNVPSLLRMSKLSAPHLIHAQGNDGHDPGGWTGIVLIAESHISPVSYTHLDVYKRQALTHSVTAADLSLEIILPG